MLLPFTKMGRTRDELLQGSCTGDNGELSVKYLKGKVLCTVSSWIKSWVRSETPSEAACLKIICIVAFRNSTESNGIFKLGTFKVELFTKRLFLEMEGIGRHKRL